MSGRCELCQSIIPHHWQSNCPNITKEMGIQIKAKTSINEPIAELERIHVEVQEAFHDQWNWMGHSFAIEQIKTFSEAKDATIAELEGENARLRKLIMEIGEVANRLHELAVQKL